MNICIKHLVFCLASLGLAQHTQAAPPFSAYFDVSEPSITADNKIIFDGVRVDGMGFSAPNDAFKLEYLFDYNSLNLTFQNTFKIYQGVGVFRDQYMVIEPYPIQPSYKVSGATYQTGTAYNFSATSANPFMATLNLTKGHYINYLTQNASTRYKVTYSGNDINYSILIDSTSVIGGTSIIRQDGVYTLKIEPADPATNLTFALTLWNGNNRSIKTISNGSNISETFRASTYEYAKYKLTLNAGDTLTVPGDNDFEVVLLDSIGREVATTPDATLVKQVDKTDTYYLFIYDALFTGRTYSGRISITPGQVRSGIRNNPSDALVNLGSGN